MYDSRSEAVGTRLVVAQLAGIVKHHAVWREPTKAEIAAAVAELHAFLGGRKDGPALLAEVAGVLIGFSEDEDDPIRAVAVAQARYCIEAGADPELADFWIMEGRERKVNARRLPFGARVLGVR